MPFCLCCVKIKPFKSLYGRSGSNHFPDINLICPRPENGAPEQSKVYYFGVLNEDADNINTVKEVVETLHEEIVIPRN